jgi:hypothetical protein
VSTPCVKKSFTEPNYFPYLRESSADSTATDPSLPRLTDTIMLCLLQLVSATTERAKVPGSPEGANVSVQAINQLPFEQARFISSNFSFEAGPGPFGGPNFSCAVSSVSILREPICPVPWFQNYPCKLGQSSGAGGSWYEYSYQGVHLPLPLEAGDPAVPLRTVSRPTLNFWVETKTAVTVRVQGVNESLPDSMRWSAASSDCNPSFCFHPNASLTSCAKPTTIPNSVQISVRRQQSIWPRLTHGYGSY